MKYVANKYVLPNDVARCHDDQCPKHEKCLLWVQRRVFRGDGMNVNNIATGRIDDQECVFFEPVIGTDVQE